MHEQSDAELMLRTRSGEHDAFATLVDRHKDALVNYLTHLTGHRDRAEDFAQEAFVRLFESSARYDERGKLAPYLFRIATNLVRSEAVKQRVRQMLLLKFVQPEEKTTDRVSPHGVMFEREMQQQVSKALEAIPVTYRAAVVLRDIEGWSYQEIAASLGCTEGTVKSRIARGRDELRNRLTRYWNGVPAREPRRAF
jgi:RNA polymerase sigma-70 factor (ECF subfamily)